MTAPDDAPTPPGSPNLLTDPFTGHIIAGRSAQE